MIDRVREKKKKIVSLKSFSFTATTGDTLIIVSPKFPTITFHAIPVINQLIWTQERHICRFDKTAVNVVRSQLLNLLSGARTSWGDTHSVYLTDLCLKKEEKKKDDDARRNLIQHDYIVQRDVECSSFSFVFPSASLHAPLDIHHSEQLLRSRKRRSVKRKKKLLCIASFFLSTSETLCIRSVFTQAATPR